MNILLTPELEEFVNKRVESGKYQDALVVIQEGLRLLEEKERIYKGRFEELRKEVMIGVEQLRRGEKIDGETAIRQLQEEIIQRSGRTPPPTPPRKRGGETKHSFGGVGFFSVWVI